MFLDAMEYLQAAAAPLHVPPDMLEVRPYGHARRRTPTRLQSHLGPFLLVNYVHLVLSLLLPLLLHPQLTCPHVEVALEARPVGRSPLAARAQSPVPLGTHL